MKRSVLFAVLLLVGVATALGGDVKRKGTSGAPEVLIPVGARGIATAGGFLASQTGVEAIFYNPAGVAAAPQSEAMFSHMSYFADITYNFGAVSANFPEIGAFALSISSLNYGDIPVTTTEFPDGDGTNYSPSAIVAGLTYSRVITDRVSAGLTAKLLSETIMSTSANGFALDFGVQYHFTSGLIIGATLKNIGSKMSFSGSDMQRISSIAGTSPGTQGTVSEPVVESFEIPSWFELGVSYGWLMAEDNLLNVGVAFRSHNTMEDQLLGGLEYTFADIFSIRAGYDYLMGNADLAIFTYSLGAGVKYQFEGGGPSVALDYAWRPVKEFPTDNHMFTVKLGL